MARQMVPLAGAREALASPKLRWPPAERAGSGVHDVTRVRATSCSGRSRQARWACQAHYFAKKLPL